MSYYKEQLKNWLNEKVFTSDRVLSIGCMNNDLDYFADYSVNELVTIDISDEYKPNVKADMNLPFWIQLSGVEKEIVKNGFNDIFAFELAEYLWNPIMFLDTCNELLIDGGKLWLSSPFIYPTHNPFDKDYLRYTEYFWKRALEETGFEITEYRRRIWKEPQYFMKAIASDGMRPAKKYNHNVTGHLIIAKKTGKPKRKWS